MQYHGVYVTHRAAVVVGFNLSGVICQRVQSWKLLVWDGVLVSDAWSQSPDTKFAESKTLYLQDWDLHHVQFFSVIKIYKPTYSCIVTNDTASCIVPCPVFIWKCTLYSGQHQLLHSDRCLPGLQYLFLHLKNLSVFKNSVLSLHKTHSISITQTSQKLLRKIIGLFWKSCEKHMVNMLCGKNSVFFMFKQVLYMVTAVL
jgi:hypothetical protein